MTGQLELVIDAKATLGEGPVWDIDSQRLFWVDILEKKIHIFDPKSTELRTIQSDQQIGAIVSHKPGHVIAAMQNGFYKVDLEKELFTAIIDPEHHLPEQRFNDGKCDAAGRFWAGTMHMYEENKPSGTLYKLNPDLIVNAVLGNVSCSNGIAWNSDNTRIYFIDSPTKRVEAFDFNLEIGSIANGRTVVQIPDGGGVPDGMTIDEEGMLWVAQWDGYQVSRWNPDTGEMLEAVRVPAARVTSCAFGGENLDDLYITTARFGLSPEVLVKQPHAGGVFRIKTEVKGLPARTFAQM